MQHRGGDTVKITVEQITKDREEEIFVRCHDSESAWVENVREAALGQRCVCGYQGGSMHRLKLSDIYYFEVVDDASFLYTQNDVYESHEKLYEFERISAQSSFFRCSKSMIVNSDKIDYIRPSLSGRFEAALSNGEMVVVSRKYVGELKRLLGV